MSNASCGTRLAFSPVFLNGKMAEFGFPAILVMNKTDAGNVLFDNVDFL
jgi:hypothetical protein